MDFFSPPIILLLLLAPAIGSFLGVLVDRLPRGQNVVRPRSTCRNCEAKLKARDLLPIVSFAISKGRCRCCGAAIPAWMLYLEVAAVGVAVWAAIIATDPLQAWIIATFFWLLIALICTDLTCFMLPDLLTGALVVVALALSWSTNNPSFTLAIWGGAIGLTFFAALRWGYSRVRGHQGLGGGDVKLMAGLGAALGPFDLPLMLLFATLSGLVFAATTGKLSGQRALPFGAALAASTGLVWLGRHIAF